MRRATELFGWERLLFMEERPCPVSRRTITQVQVVKIVNGTFPLGEESDLIQLGWYIGSPYLLFC